MYNYVYKGKHYFNTETHGNVRLYMHSDKGLVVRNNAVLMTGSYADARSYFERIKKAPN